MNKSEIISDIERIIEDNKDTFYRVVLDIKSGHFDFPPEVIMNCMDCLFEEIKTHIERSDNDIQ